MNQNEKKFHELHEELTKTFLHLIKACRQLTPNEDGQEITVSKGHSGILKEAREWLKQNHIEMPNPKKDSEMAKLQAELSEYPAEWDEDSTSH
jgi:hypothetical protein